MDSVESRDEFIRSFGNDETLTAAVQQGVRAALARHKQAGNPVATLQDGKVVWIAPEDIELPEVETSQGISI